jgi:hypothetical protein
MLRITRRAACAPFLATVGTEPIRPRRLLAGLAPATLRANTTFNRHPIGWGPDTVAHVTVGGHVGEEANRDYFGGVPAVGRRVFAPIRVRASALVARLVGDPHR